MRRFCIHICFGVLLFCVVWIVSETGKEYIYIPNHYSTKYKRVKNNNAIKTLLIGHSHFENSLNPYLMGDSIYDFAIAGRQWIYWDLKLAEDVFPTMPNLSMVIFPIGYDTPYFSPHFFVPDEETKNYIYHYSKYMHVHYDKFPDNLIFGSALINNDMKIKFWREDRQDSLGYYPIHGQIRDWTTNHNILPDVIEGERSAMAYKEFTGYFIRLAKVCYENNIRFVVVTCPCANCYIANTREQGIKNLYALVDSVAAYYPIEYYNYLEDKEFRDDSLYFNCSHLNSMGADKLALRLMRDLKL